MCEGLSPCTKQWILAGHLPIQFWCYMPRDSVRFHRMRAQSPRLPPTSNTTYKSGPPKLLTNRLQVRVPMTPTLWVQLICWSSSLNSRHVYWLITKDTARVTEEEVPRARHLPGTSLCSAIGKENVWSQHSFSQDMWQDPLWEGLLTHNQKGRVRLESCLGEGERRSGEIVSWSLR